MRTEKRTKSIVGKINLLFFAVIAISAGAIVSIYMLKLSRDMVALDEKTRESCC